MTDSCSTRLLVKARLRACHGHIPAACSHGLRNSVCLTVNPMPAPNLQPATRNLQRSVARESLSQ
jgi:hypothetical protein